MFYNALGASHNFLLFFTILFTMLFLYFVFPRAYKDSVGNQRTHVDTYLIKHDTLGVYPCCQNSLLRHNVSSKVNHGYHFPSLGINMLLRWTVEMSCLSGHNMTPSISRFYLIWIMHMFNHQSWTFKWPWLSVAGELYDYMLHPPFPQLLYESQYYSIVFLLCFWLHSRDTWVPKS